MVVTASVRFLCRICLAEPGSKHSFVLLSPSSLKQDWPRRASELLQLSLTDEEGLLRHLCKNCKAKVLSVGEKLQVLSTQAQRILKLLEETHSGSRKRTKDTSSGVLSPTRSLHALLQSGNRISFGGLPKSDSACHLVGQQPCQGPLPPSMILASVSLRRAAPANHRQTTSHYHSKLDD